MFRWPWEYLFTVFNAKLGSFYTPFWVANLVLLVATIVIYSVATRGSRGNGVLGDGTLEGNEEALTTFSDALIRL